MTIRNGIVPLLIVVVVVLAICGCLGTKTPVSSGQAPPALLVDYHRTGGFAGVDDHLLLFDNGAGLISTRSVSREFQLNRTVVTEDTVIPFTLQPVIRELNAIISSRSTQDIVSGSLANIRA